MLSNKNEHHLSNVKSECTTLEMLIKRMLRMAKNIDRIYNLMSNAKMAKFSVPND